jgi:glycosyltransferase involved in cell wall biosynthesis
LPPKLLLLTSGLGLGGAEALLIDFAVLLRAKAWRVEIRSLISGGHHRDTLAGLGFDVADFDMQRGTASLTGLRRAIAGIRASDADIVQCWMYHANFVGALASLPFGRRPLYFGIFSTKMNFSRYNYLTRATFKACAVLSRRASGVVYNGVRAAVYHESEGYRADRSIVIHNSVDFQRFRPDAARRAAVRRELGLAGDARVVVVAARNDPQKDWASMLEAARLVPGVMMLATGLGTESLEAPPNVMKLGPRRDIEAIYAASDAFMLLSNFGEGTSVAMCEAMAVGLPAVTTDLGDNAVMLGAAGIVAPMADPIAAAKALQGLFGNADRYAAMSKAALQRVHELCAPDAAFAPLLAAYDRALAERAASSP